MKAKDIKKFQDESNKTKESFSSIDSKFKEIRADLAEKSTDDKMYENMNYIFDVMENAIRYTHQRINQLEDSFYNYAYEHSKGHLPSIPGSDKMNKALKTLGLDGDYAAEPKRIYASIEKNRIVVNASYKKNK